MGSVGRYITTFVLLLARRITLRFDFWRGKVVSLSENLWNKIPQRKIRRLLCSLLSDCSSSLLSVSQSPLQLSVIPINICRVLVLLTGALRGAGQLAPHPHVPAAAKQTSQKVFLQNREKFCVHQWWHIQEKQPPEDPLFQPSSFSAGWGKSELVVLTGGVEIDYICLRWESNFLGVCCMLKTAPSWFCSKRTERNPLCFVIVLTSASHHLKII